MLSHGKELQIEERRETFLKLSNQRSNYSFHNSYVFLLFAYQGQLLLQQSQLNINDFKL